MPWSGFPYAPMATPYDWPHSANGVNGDMVGWAVGGVLFGVTLCAVFLIGLLALPFAPETKGLPLPE